MISYKKSNIILRKPEIFNYTFVQIEKNDKTGEKLDPL